MSFRICGRNNKTLIFHLTFCDAIKSGSGLKFKNAACDVQCFFKGFVAVGDVKRADIMSDDQFQK